MGSYLSKVTTGTVAYMDDTSRARDHSVLVSWKIYVRNPLFKRGTVMEGAGNKVTQDSGRLLILGSNSMDRLPA